MPDCEDDPSFEIVVAFAAALETEFEEDPQNADPLNSPVQDCFQYYINEKVCLARIHIRHFYTQI
jgi:hypothetical protein